jgi:endoglucanase
VTGRRRPRRAVIAVVAALAVATMFPTCGREPDRSLDPDPPAVTYEPLRHPFRGARLFVDRDTAAARWQRAHAARWLDPITTRPQARWLNGPEDLVPVPVLAQRSRRQKAVLVLVAYYLPNRGCSNYREGAPTAADYRRWIARLVSNLGRTRAVVILEPDALPAGCFDDRRAALMTQSVRTLAAAGHSVYIDAGHPRWKPSGETADRLLAAGIASAEGFAVNVSNRQSTRDSHRWGLELSDLLGGRPFVVDVSRNGLGPPPDDPGRDDEWCNPARQALGAEPTTRPGLPGVAALLWIKRPGESDGACGGEDSYLFSPRQARILIANSPAVDPPARRLAAAAP